MFSANPQWGAYWVSYVFVSVVTLEGIEDAGAMWDRSIAYEDYGENTFPLLYGAPLDGRPHIYQLAGEKAQPARSIGPKPLTIGVLYEIHATTGATCNGCRRFQMESDRKVQSFSCS